MQTTDSSVDHGATDADRLWATYQSGRDKDARNRLVLYYAPLVAVTVNRMGAGITGFHQREDLHQWGQIGLIDAIERFELTEDASFATYATYRIRGAILDEVRRGDLLPKQVRARVRDYQDARDTLSALLVRTATLKELAEYMDLDVAAVLELSELEALAYQPASLNQLIDFTGGLALRNGAETSERAERASLRDAVRSALEKLTDRQRHAVVLHYLEGFKKSEVAEVLGVDRSRVTQLLHAGVKNLKVELDGAYDLAI